MEIILAVIKAIIQNWDEIVIKWKGKRIAVLGARGVGKTYLIKFLTTGSVPNTPQGNITAEKTRANRMKIDECELNIKEGIDVTGTTDAYLDWKNATSKADFIFYMFRVDQLYMADEAACNRVLRDLENIKRWKSRQQLYLIGTYLDQLPASSESELLNLIDKFKKLRIAEKMSSHAGSSSKWIFGSAENEQGCKSIALAVFRSE